PQFAVSFFFYVYGDHRDLHSFPTRRSSDLLMVQDYLSLARIEEGKIELRQERFDLCPLLEEIVQDAQLLSARHQITLTGCNMIRDRKSTRLNSSHVKISYAVFCLKKKTTLQ